MSEFSLSAKKRLIKDIVSLSKSPLIDEGIYYTHDDDNIQYGYAVIIGPKDSPYEDGIYMFRFKFPYNYPVSPPKVEFMTSYNQFRFHPNYYVSGKVCLSILNTWPGEKWTSSLTLRFILVTLQSIMTKNALTNEPGVTVEKHNERIISYDNAVSYNNIAHCISLFQNVPTMFNMFDSMINKHIQDKYFDFMKRLDDMKKYDNTHFQTMYNSRYYVYKVKELQNSLKELMEN